MEDEIAVSAAFNGNIFLEIRHNIRLHSNDLNDSSILSTFWTQKTFIAL